ncbi:endogenous retrovirus group 3 member 1 Env polyprotein-like [Ahaetulla prasina]|uniref:endogenous retrovirus group 3 member 1 Env polyprotein-like n=1 Tax=Ahaetulla prasina TaxID=499056 RepID=UPI002647724E|nr:endogenous retrovirus group 3 member 1 Env polyprotein-like [Ahaetulla prasina]
MICKNKDPQTCTINGTTYSICKDRDKMQCYDLTGPTHRYNIKILAGEGQNKKIMVYKDFYNPNNAQSIIFDACEAMDLGTSKCGSLNWRRTYSQNEKYICACISNRQDPCGRGTYCGEWKCVDFQSQGTTVRTDTIAKNDKFKKLYITRGTPPSLCYQHTCNPVNLTFPMPNNWLQSQTWKGYNDDYGLGINGKGSDPSVKIKILVTKISLNPTTHSLFHSSYEEFQKLKELPVPAAAKNTFLTLAETIAKTLQIKNCFVCGGTMMREQWPWQAQEVEHSHIASSWSNFSKPADRNETWALTTNLIGKICYQRSNTSSRTFNAGSLLCLGTWENNTWWSGSNTSAPPCPLQDYLIFLNDTENDTISWVAPSGLYWICGRFAYSILPAAWFGSCVLGTIRSGFFLLPLQQRQYLGHPVYEEIGHIQRKRREIPSFNTKDIHKGNWKDNEWPPQCIISYYGPATWTEDDTWGYQAPIYMLNHIIRLQAVVELITDETLITMKKLAAESVKS